VSLLSQGRGRKEVGGLKRCSALEGSGEGHRAHTDKHTKGAHAGCTRSSLNRGGMQAKCADTCPHVEQAIKQNNYHAVHYFCH
jgi:hypothetical protein